MKFCSDCGANVNGAKFCPECGMKNSALPSAPDDYYYQGKKQPPPPPPPILPPTALPPTAPPSHVKVVPVSSIYSDRFVPQGSARASSAPPIAIPEAATGEEAQRLYNTCITTFNSSGGNTDKKIACFKENCKAFGQSHLQVKSFYDSLVADLGDTATANLIPTLVRLIPDANKRRELLEEDSSRRPWLHRSSSSDSNNEGLPKTRRSMSTGIMSDRYKDHPNCDICSLTFDVTKRRHQCRHCGSYVCSSCSPGNMLIPEGKQIPGCRGYDPSIPQRTCISCVPLLLDCQEELRRIHGNFNKNNPHQADDRIHLPYSDTVDKECRNAADILGNFFRGKWGASADQAVPIAFLKNCKGLAFMTIVKVGFLFTGKLGTGIVIAKLPDGSWSPPSAIGTAGFGSGLEIGGELIQLMLILGSEGAVKVFHRAQVNIGAGLDLTIGPYGRVAQAAAAAGAGGLNCNYSYSHSKGFFAGMSLQGAIIATRKSVNRKFYGRDVTARDILEGKIETPKAAEPLYQAIADAIANCKEYEVTQQEAAAARGGCLTCGCERFLPHTTQVWNKNCKNCGHVHTPNSNRVTTM